MRADNIIYMIAPTDKIEKSKEQVENPVTLFKVAYRYSNYYLYHSTTLTDDTFNDSSLMIWHILKATDHIDSDKERDPAHPYRHPLSEGEVVKFGRVSYKITRIFLPDNHHS